MKKCGILIYIILLLTLSLMMTSCSKTKEYYADKAKDSIRNEMQAKIPEDFLNVYTELERTYEVRGNTYYIYNIVVVVSDDLEENYVKLFEYAHILKGANTNVDDKDNPITLFKKYIESGGARYRLSDSSYYADYDRYKDYILIREQPDNKEVYNAIAVKCGENLTLQEKAVIYGFLVHRFELTKSDGTYLYPINMVWQMTAEDFNVSVSYVQSIYNDPLVGEEYRG